MRVEVLDRSQRKRVEEALKVEFGVEEGLGEELVVLSGSEGKVRVATPEALEVARSLGKFESVGLYVLKLTKFGTYLSLEGSQLLGDRIRRNVVEVGMDQLKAWMRGDPIPLESVKGSVEGHFAVLRWGDVYAGSGKVSRDGRIHPQIPKHRRLLGVE
ncbi:MAG: hypothetical protein NZ733_01340 [Aigarchaeota archaeon]|nr:hypothetical protein [Aigarchaeota archaeon]MCX8203724.1 hypothetical protein [Nitrososphaeria archaeon]MDW8043729.1 hypothetical protein [Nitrososphaerota archaeon]